MRAVELHCRDLTQPFAPGLLSPDELARADRFRFARDRERFIACRSMLREILGAYLNLDPRAVEFAFNPQGKPGVAGIYFNVSHSDALAAIAVSRTREVGIDIERMDARAASEKVPERFFAPAEVAALRALPEHLQTEAFFRCWTRKEAYVKARGLGLSIDLAGFEVTVEERAAFLRGGEGWEIESFCPAPGYQGAVVAKL